MSNERIVKFKFPVWILPVLIIFYLISCVTQLSAQEIDISGTWRGVAEYGDVSANLTCYLSQDGSTVTGTCESPGAYPTICGPWIGNIYGTVVSNIFYFDGTSPTKDLDSCEVICLDPLQGAFTISGNVMAGNLTEEFCVDGEIMYVTVILYKEEEPTVYFLDKDNPSRQVSGAAADGASKVIIQISNIPEDITLDKVQVNIADGDGSLEDDAIISNRVFTQTYVPPQYFVRGGHSEDISQGKREIGLTIRVDGQDVEHPEFYLIKPPVVLLHGLWDNVKVWDNQGSKRGLKTILKEDYGYQYVYAHPYNSSVSFNQLNLVIDTAINLALGSAKVDNFVSKKADVVAHSMGGLVTKLYGNESNIRSITTVGTPHFGSPWADEVCDAVGCELEEAQLTLLQKGLAWFMKKYRHPARDGAIKDLRETGGQHCEASRIDVPNYVISGISDPNEQPNPGFFNIMLYVLNLSNPALLSMSPSDLHSYLFGEEERSDWFVSESSQEGNFAGAVEDDVLEHSSEPTDDGVLQKIINFLHRTSSTALMVQSAETKSQLAPKLLKAVPNLEMGISSGDVQITNPIEGQVFQPGDTVNIEIDVSNENSLVIIGTSTGDAALIEHAPYSFQFMIPINSIGPLEIFTVARDDIGFIGSDEVAINVASTANLIDMEVYPEFDPLDLLLGASVPLTIYGLYDDAVTRDITSSGTGTSYISSNLSVVEISSEGLLTTKSQGEAIITIGNSGLQKVINVVVVTRKGPESSDFDGDRKSDITVWRPGDGGWYIINSKDGSILSQQWGSGALNDVPVPGDYDGDGKTDIAIWRPGDGYWYIINSKDESVTATQWGSSALNDVLVPGDYDGDGKTDIAVWRPGEGYWYIISSKDGSIISQQWGAGYDPYNDVPVPGDYDGDGKTDIAIWRPADGYWYIINSKDGSVTATQWGSSALNDVLVPGDYDGDGKTDIAVWRPGEGYWYIISSKDGSVISEQWGAGYAPYNDKPVPGDYDGDGKTDIAIWRPGDGYWYIVNSKNGSITATQWGAGYDPYNDEPISQRLN